MARRVGKKLKPKMKSILLKTPPEQMQTITRTLLDIVKEHGPLTIGDTWERVKEVGLTGLKGKSHMKILLRRMSQKQKLRMICNHCGPHKQFLYTTWSTKAQRPDRSAGSKNTSDIGTSFDSIPMLSDSNFKKWKEHVSLYLGAADLDFALRHDQPPAIKESSSEEEKKAFDTWERSNKMRHDVLNCHQVHYS